MKVPKNMLKNCGCGTQREWRRLKRAQLFATIRAMEEVYWGCVYTPKVQKVYLGAMRRQLKQLREAWSVKQWGK